VLIFMAEESGNFTRKDFSMKHFLTFLSLAFATQAMADNAPGLIERNIEAPHHGRQMPMAIWYPAEDGAVEKFAENPVFQGGGVRRNAQPLPGKHPVILMSHGMGGSYLSLNWLASGLAEKGAIVISVNHPNGWFKDRQVDKMFNHWTRVQDLEVAIEAVLADPTFASKIDPDRIYATGFSFGGWTALSLGGATASPTGSLSYCKAAGERSHNCMDLQHFGLTTANTNNAEWTANYKDSRIKAVAAIDPGLTWDMRPENVRDLDQKTLLVIGLGTGNDQHYATDTSALGSNFDALVPQSKKVVLAPATHFTAMPLCTDIGAAILATEKDDPVCTDPLGTDRKAVHDKIIDEIAKQFELE
jgi:predicted dienelactone hydrolase